MPSRHFITWCTILQIHPRTSLKSARFHSKSTIAVGYLAWKIYRMIHGYGTLYQEWLYLSYKEDGAEYQIRRLKRYIEALPEAFFGLADVTDAESKISFQFQEKKFVINPAGMFSFKRGQHPDGIIADDILRDPQTPLSIDQLLKIERAFIEQVEPMPKHELHLFGTPQDENDLFKKLEGMTGYHCGEYPAILDEAKRIVLWPEKYSFDKLIELRHENNWGPKAFNKEMMCRAVRSEEGYFKAEQYDALIEHRRPNYPHSVGLKLNDWAYAGFDIGKKAHPSHLFVLAPNRKKVLIQIHSKFMDGWNYVDQMDYLKHAIQSFKIAKLLYDDTRAEFETFKERADLPGEMDGVSFTGKNKYSMATDLDSIVSERGIRFLPDQRQRRLILSVDNSLQAVQTREGHGDCFFSLCLAIRAYKEGQGLGVFEI